MNLAFYMALEHSYLFAECKRGSHPRTAPRARATRLVFTVWPRRFRNHLQADIDARLVELTQHPNLHHTSSAPQFIPPAKCRCNTALAGDLRLCITSHRGSCARPPPSVSMQVDVEGTGGCKAKRLRD